MALLTLSVLGGFDARLGDRPLALSRKAQALLAYVAMPPGHAHSRATLAGLLWSDSGEEQARNSLRQVLFEIRRAMGKRGDRIFRVDHERAELLPDGTHVDAVALEQLAREGTPGAL